MVTFFIGMVLVLHGLVHLWYVVLAQRIVDFRPEMGWTGESWLMSSLTSDAVVRWIASVLFTVVAFAFVSSGIGVLMRTAWWRPVLLASTIASTAIILMFWDGRGEMLVEKGLVALLINAAVLGVLVVGQNG